MKQLGYTREIEVAKLFSAPNFQIGVVRVN